MSSIMSLLVSLPLLAGVFGVSETPPAPVFESVEVGVAELSPAGESGGYAVPASASSGVTCTLTLTPNPSSQGQNVVLTWTNGLASMTVFRGGVNLGSRSSGWTDTSASGLAAGSYVYQISGSVTSCGGGGRDGEPSCSTTNYSCSRTLTVNPRPDLTTSNVVLNSGSLVVGTPVTFRGTVQNSNAGTGVSFSNTFFYRYGSSGAFIPISTSTQAALAAGGSAQNTSNSITFGSSGSVQVVFCADSGRVISESSELNNCTTATFNVTGNAPSVTSCTASPNPALAGQQVTWTANITGGTAPFTYQWSGSEGLSGTYNVNTVSHTYASAGTKNATVIVTGSPAQSSAPYSCTALTVNNPPTPTVTLDIREMGTGSWGNSATVDFGEDVELQWSSSNAERCVGDSYFSTGAGQPTSGTESTVSEPSSGSRVYTATCYNDTYGTNNSDTATVNITPPSGNPTLVVDPGRVRQGENADIDWNTGGNANCVITGTNGDVFDLQALYPGQQSGTITSGAINGETVYTISCDTGTPSTATVRIFPVFEEI